MTHIQSQQEVDKEFDSEFTDTQFSDDFLETTTTPKVKKYIQSIRLQDIQAIREMAAEKRVSAGCFYGGKLENSLYDKACKDILSLLDSVEGEIKGTKE